MGGGLYIYSQNGTVENCDFSGQLCQCRGRRCLWEFAGTITLNKNTFTNNTSPGGLGSGLYVHAPWITLTENTFTNNSGSSQGGGAYLSTSSGQITVTNNKFINNSSLSYAGGLSAYFKLRHSDHHRQ